jgi:Zn-dependent protease with chaperone function
MMLLGLIPLAASVLLSHASGGLSRRLSPRSAAPLLTLLALATSAATGVVLCLAAFSVLARQRVVAAVGGWSLTTWRQWDQVPARWGLLAALVAAGLLAGAVMYLARISRELVRARRACRRLVVGDDKLVITQDEHPTAYAVPAGQGAIVVSTGMLRLLSADERRALLAHEAAHLRHHHASYVQLAQLAAAANPLLRPLARTVRLAVELWADQDAAKEVGDRRIVARALARASLAAARQDRGPGVALSLAETDVSARVRALTNRPPRLHPWAVAAALTLTLASSATAATLTWTMHQRVEIAQLAYAQAHAAALAQPTTEHVMSPPARNGDRSADDRRKWLALVAAIMGSFVTGLDATAVNVALPAIRVDLGGGLAGQQWVSNAYLLALGSPARRLENSDARDSAAVTGLTRPLAGNARRIGDR